MDLEKLEAAVATTLKALEDIRIYELSNIKTHKHVKSAGFGDVYVGEMYRTGQPVAKVAIKKFRPSGSRGDCLRVAAALGRELRVWAGAPHLRILPPLAFFIDDEDFTKAWIITDWQAFGDMPKFLAEHDPTHDERLTLALDIAEALEFLHGLTIAHADIKPGNALVNDQRRGLLCDFGFARTLDGASSGLTTTTVGMTFRYASPEQVHGDTHGTIQSDIWSWGCLFMEVVAGVAPYSQAKKDQQVVILVMRNVPPADISTLRIDDAAKQILRDCWKADGERPPMTAVVNAVRGLVQPVELSTSPTARSSSPEPPATVAPSVNATSTKKGTAEDLRSSMTFPQNPRIKRVTSEKYRRDKLLRMGAVQDHSIIKEANAKERALHEGRLAGMESEMRMVLQQRIQEKEAKLRQSEAELWTRYREMKDPLEKQKEELEVKRIKLERGPRVPEPTAEERELHEAMLAKMNDEMQTVFLRQVQLKETRLRGSEEELYSRHREMKEALEKARVDLEEKKRTLERSTSRTKKGIFRFLT